MGGVLGERATGSPQLRGGLAALAVAEGGVVPIQQLVDALWAEEPPDTAIVTIRTYLSRIKKLYGEDAIVRIGTGYALRNVETDLADFRRFIDAGEFREA